ncbi:DNA repair protein RadC [Porticoccaceae bacterium]|nr:DNA repair protein RadC [Porticoccaceae bacterium]MDB2635091.1 DNA repair protein RadC [Porticoccaceae bacterium]
MAIPQLNKDHRPREKLLSKGVKVLSDAELLAIFLRTGVAGTSAIELAAELLEKFSGLSLLLNADVKQFCAIKGLGPAKYCQLHATLELTKRYLEEQLESEQVFNRPQQVENFLAVQMSGYQREVFSIMLLNSQHRLLGYHELFYGTIDSATIHPREVVRLALEKNAAAVIAAHNHPSGATKPSRADIAITKQLQSALELFDIRLVDHFIIGRGEVSSLAQLGEI